MLIILKHFIQLTYLGLNPGLADSHFRLSAYCASELQRQAIALFAFHQYLNLTCLWNPFSDYFLDCSHLPNFSGPASSLYYLGHFKNPSWSNQTYFLVV